MSGTMLQWECQGATCYGSAGRHTVAAILPSGTPDSPSRLLWGCLGRSDIAHGLPAAQAACQAAWEAFVSHAGLVPAGEADGWRPIAEAPRDGTPVLVAIAGGDFNACSAQWDIRRGCWTYPCAVHGPGLDPTHWCPLPGPPVATGHLRSGSGT